MKRNIIFILFFIFLGVSAALLLIYYQNKEKQVAPFQKLNDTFLEDDIKPVGIIKNEELTEVKLIGGYLKQFDQEKIVLSEKKDSENNLRTILKDENIVHLKAKYLLDAIGYDIENVLPEELENLINQKAYVQVLVKEIVREDGETTYRALNILFFPD